MTTVWQLPNQIDIKSMSSAHWAWLVHPGSLTNRFKEIFGDSVHFSLQNSGWAHAIPEESQLLDSQLKDQHWVREINWRYKEECWVVARAIIPPNENSHFLQKVIDLGEESIGKLLFSQSEIQPEPIEIAKLNVQHPYFNYAKPWLGNLCEGIWARRRLFAHQDDSLLITEIFLPSFFTHVF